MAHSDPIGLPLTAADRAAFAWSPLPSRGWRAEVERDMEEIGPEVWCMYRDGSDEPSAFVVRIAADAVEVTAMDRGQGYGRPVVAGDMAAALRVVGMVGRG